jgi:hypothetical protein
MRFVGASATVQVTAGEALPGTVNDFRGSNPTTWRAGLPTYAGIEYRALFPGITLRYQGAGGQLKGTYTVAAGTDPAAIRWRYAGVERVGVDAGGNLQATVRPAIGSGTAAVSVTEQAPVAWQVIDGARVAVATSYALRPGGDVGFQVGSYDPRYPLIIDPTLTYSTYLGGNGVDTGYAIAVDGSGNAYVTGGTVSTNFPLVNQVQRRLGGDNDVFITKLNPAL